MQFVPGQKTKCLVNQFSPQGQLNWTGPIANSSEKKKTTHNEYPGGGKGHQTFLCWNSLCFQLRLGLRAFGYVLFVVREPEERESDAGGRGGSIQIKEIKGNKGGGLIRIPTKENRRRAEYGFGEHGFKHRAQGVLWPSPSPWERAPSVPLSFCIRVQSELTKFFAELTVLAAELSEFLFRNSTLETVFLPFPRKPPQKNTQNKEVHLNGNLQWIPDSCHRLKKRNLLIML